MDELKGKKLLVLGGARLSCEIIEAAHEMGVYVVVTDYNVPEDSPGKQIADESFMVSTIDVDAVVDLIKRENIDGVLVGFVDMLLPYYAEICEKSGLPCYGTAELFDLFINKTQYKEKLRQYGIPTVEEYSADTVEDDVTADDFPLLIKPSDSSGARGITICESKEDLKEALDKARSFSKTGEVLVERYIDAPEATIFWLFVDGKCYLTDIGNRHIRNSQDGVIPLPVGYSYPSSILPEFCSGQEENYRKMFDDVGMQNGIMFVQCKVENGVCIAYDIGYRLTGSLEYRHMERIYGLNPLKMMIRFALTGDMGDRDKLKNIDPYHKRKAFNVTCLTKPGTIKEIKGCDLIESMPEVEGAILAHVPGETIPESSKGLLAQAAIRIIGTTDTEDDLYPVMDKIYSTIHIISDRGEDLLLPGLEAADIAGRII